MSTASVDISSLYHRRRILNTSILWTFGLFLYTPLGIVLAIIRLFLFLQLAIFLRLVPKRFPLRRWWFRGIQPGLGFIVTTEGFEHRKPDSPKILVANHVTLIDHCMVESVIPCIAVIDPSRCPVMQRTMSHGSFSVTEGQRLTGRLKEYLQGDSALPILTHPENGVNTGAAVMAFKQWPFSVEPSVQPIVITSSRPLPLAPHYFHSKIIPDLFFFLFVPFTKFHIRVLPSVTKLDDETDEEFCSRVQELMASALSVPACQHTRRDIVEHLKREEQELLRAASTPSSPARHANSQHPHGGADGGGGGEGLMSAYGAMPELSPQDRMVRQVQEVFPHAPYNAVARDLAKSKSVDTTISNILEGRLNIEVPDTPPARVKPKKSSVSSAKQSTPDKKSLSFEEQKQELIVAARERFLKRTGAQQ